MLRPILDKQVTPNVRVRSWEVTRAIPRAHSTAHETVEIAWSERGALTYSTRGRTLHVARGSAIVVPPGVDHATTCSDDLRCGSLWLSLELVRQVAEVAGARVPDGNARLLASSARIATIGALLTEDAHAQDALRFHSAESLAEAIAVELVERREERATLSRAVDPRIRRALQEIESSYAEPLTIDRLAATACMSRFHFGRVFREQVGQSPLQALIATRIDRAAALLRTGRYDVTEAALTVGFRDLGRFSRAFKRKLGCLPSELAGRARFADRSARIAER